MTYRDRQRLADVQAAIEAIRSTWSGAAYPTESAAFYLPAGWRSLGLEHCQALPQQVSNSVSTKRFDRCSVGLADFEYVVGRGSRHENRAALAAAGPIELSGP